MAEPLSIATPKGRGDPMSATLTTGTIIADHGGVEDADDLRASTGLLLGVTLSCALWAGIVAAVVAII